MNRMISLDVRGCYRRTYVPNNAQPNGRACAIKGAETVALSKDVGNDDAIFLLVSDSCFPKRYSVMFLIRNTKCFTHRGASQPLTSMYCWVGWV